MSFAASISKVQ